MEPRIQYCTTPDGVHLAFYVAGAGPTVVHMSSFGAMGHIQSADVGQFVEHLSERLTVVRYDQRGRGLSDREPADYSLDAHVSDVLTVLDVLALERTALIATNEAGPVALTFACRYPERVSHLILRNAAASAAAIAQSPRVGALRSLIELDWELYTEFQAYLALGLPYGNVELARRGAAQLRASTTPAQLLRMFETQRAWDATSLLNDIGAPTLVLVALSTVGFNAESRGRALAAGIPGAMYCVVEGTLSSDEANRAIREFVTGEREQAPRPAPVPEGMAVILFCDVVDSTALTEQLGDAVYRARASRLDAAMRLGIREEGGSPVEGKVLGDGVMGVFSVARRAIAAAQYCLASADGTGLALHIGMHAGDVINEGDNVFGGAVNIASRICTLCAPGEILVSQTVRDLARTSAGVTFEDRGEQLLKGVDDAVRVFAVTPASQ